MFVFLPFFRFHLAWKPDVLHRKQSPQSSSARLLPLKVWERPDYRALRNTRILRCVTLHLCGLLVFVHLAFLIVSCILLILLLSVVHLSSGQHFCLFDICTFCALEDDNLIETLTVKHKTLKNINRIESIQHLPCASCLSSLFICSLILCIASVLSVFLGFMWGQYEAQSCVLAMVLCSLRPVRSFIMRG